MANYYSLTNSPAQRPNRGACTLQNFWRGLLDWCNEKIHGPAPGERPTEPLSKARGSVAWLFLVVPLGILAVALVFPLMAPALVAGMTSAGTTVVANTSIGMSVGIALALAVGIPFMIGRRFYRFAHHCCERGQELAQGTRKPAGPRCIENR